MKPTVPYQPKGYHSVTPYLVVDGAAELIEFLKKSLDAAEERRMTTPDGKIRHAEVRIGDALVMLSDATDQYPAYRALLQIYVPDVDATYQQALDSGAKSLREPADQFYGDRTAGVEDASGCSWWLATHIEDLTDEEIHQRFESMAQGRSGS